MPDRVEYPIFLSETCGYSWIALFIVHRQVVPWVIDHKGLLQFLGFSPVGLYGLGVRTVGG